MKKLFTLFFIFVIPFVAYSKYWEKIDLPSGYNNNLYLDVYFLKSNPNYGWVCGFNGKVLRTTNRGKTWTGSSIPSANHLENIHFANPSFGITSGPAGVYRSINGGATWTEITPAVSGSYWGNYVGSNDFAIVIGGGCAGNQEFRYSIDGGDTWILNSKTVPNSGLTDVKIIVPGGLGFATSSGMIWITEDGGLSWDVLTSSGSNIWQEEVSYSGGSFLVPYAGDNCQGSSIGGGMRFSADYGQNWRDYSIGIPMYGSFLNSSTEGWGCGVDREVVHTTDAGQSWKLKNCGIDYGDLDDIWFINDDEGWVVGDGIYKLSDPISGVTPAFIRGEQYCVNEIKYDTVWIRNYSFYNEDVNIEIVGDPVFSITKPTNQNFTILGCDREFVIIQTSATSAGTYNAELLVTYKPGEGSLEETFTVDLEVNIIESTAKPETNELIIDDLYCNTLSSNQIAWSSTNFDEFITNVIKVNDDDEFSFDEMVPVEISKTTRNIDYNVVLKDTGWSEETFLHKLSPCDEEVEITIKAYGVSSIINGPDELNFYTQCNEPVIDSIPITNTGNHQLRIDDVYFVGSNPDIDLLGWDNPFLSVIIDINETKYLKLKYFASKSGQNSYTLRLINNDSTKVNGNKNPFDIIINTDNENVELSARDTVIYLDSVCVGDEASGVIYLRNFGSEPATLLKPDLKDGFSLFSINQFPLNINPFDSISFNILYNPEVPGLVSDTITLKAEPCEQSVKVIVHGFGMYSELNPIPDEMSSVIQSLETYQDTFLIENNSNISLDITNISINPNPQNITFDFKPDVPFNVAPYEDFEVIVEYTAKTDTSYSGELEIQAEGECDIDFVIPVDIISQSRLVEHDPKTVDYGIYYCEFPDVQKEITIENMGVKNDTIVSYELIGDVTNFELFGFDTPMEIVDELKFYVNFTPKSEGIFNTEIIIKTKDPNGQTITIPVRGEFYKSEFELLDEDITSLEIVEHCDDTLFYSFRFTNNGMLTDTLFAEDMSDFEGFYIENDLFEVKSNDTVNFDFYIVPSELSSEQLFENRVEVYSLVCDTTFYLQIPVERIKPRLTYEPVRIRISDLWMRDTVESSFVISNTTDYEIYVEDIFTQKAEPELIFDTSPGFYVSPGEEVEIGFYYVAANEGLNENTIQINERRNCIDSNFVSTEILVDEEIYNIDLFIDEYEVSPGDKVGIELVLTDSVYKFYPEETNFEIGFNERLFYPESVNVKNGSFFTDLEYSVDNGFLSVTIEEDISSKLFNSSGTILVITGTALAYIPNSTDLIISDPEFLPENQPVVFNKDDGKLTVVDFCEPESEYNRFMPAPIIIDGQSVYYESISIGVKSDKQKSIEYKIYDIFGTDIISDNLEVIQGINDIRINSDNIPSGTYYLKITDGNRLYMKKLIYIK